MKFENFFRKAMNTQIILTLGLVFLFSCYDVDQKVDESEYNEIKITEDSSYKNDEYIKEAKIIFYQMRSPVEMAKLFQRTNPSFNPKILNPVDNHYKYCINNLKSPLNLGVYGVDLSYTRMFDQPQSSDNYLLAIQKLSQSLGIPQNKVSFTIKRIEKNITDKDSLFQIVSDDFAAADIYLRDNERKTSATLITLGGWVESIYIALNILKNNPDKEIMERIAEQKYTLNSLISLVSKCQNEISVAQYLIKLRNLKEVYDKIEIYYEPDALNIDTVNKTITTEKNYINVTIEQIKEIENIILSLRSDIIR